MTHWKHLVVALVAAFALAACSSSDNGGTASTETPPPAETGPTQEELDEANKRADDAEAEAATEKERADELQAEKDREQAMKDLATARAMFNALRLEIAISGNPRTGGETTGQTDATARSPQVTIPPLGKPDGGMFMRKVGTTEWSSSVLDTMESSDKVLFGDSSFAEATGRYVDGVYSFEADDPAPNAGIKSSNFPSAGIRNYPAGQREFSGTFHGASGIYSCSNDTCTATWTASGIDLPEGWTFTPQDGARVTVPDANFQSFGWWLRKNEDGTLDAGPVYFHSFAAGNGLTNFDTLQGEATYEGRAIGKYAIYSGAFSERSEAGHFTADATLTADFGDATTAGSISGYINGFMTDAGAKDDWRVNLAEDDSLTAGAFSGATTWIIDGVKSSTVQGAYAGQMYDTRADQDSLPYEAGGTFDARFEEGVGEMVGAFAATRE